MKSIRIGLITPGWPGHKTPNGIATAVYHLAMGLKMNGHRPVILTSNIDGVMPKNIPVVPIMNPPWSLTEKLKAKFGRTNVQHDIIGKNWANAVEIAKQDHGIDIVLVEETWGWASAITQRNIVPVIIVLHGPWLLHKTVLGDGSAIYERREACEAAIVTQAAAIISVSQNVLAAMDEALDLGTVPRTVIPNAFAPDQNLAAALSKGPILFVGRFDRLKGGDTVLEAFRKLHMTNPKACLTFVGPDKGLLQTDGSSILLAEVLSELPISARNAIKVLGCQTKDQIAVLRATHPIAVIASRYETFGYTMLEAMAAGQAIVSTRVGGLAEVLEDGKTALLVPPDDPDAMAEAIGRLVNNPELAARLGNAAQEQVKTHFHPQLIAERTTEFITRAVGLL